MRLERKGFKVSHVSCRSIKFRSEFRQTLRRKASHRSTGSRIYGEQKKEELRHAYHVDLEASSGGFSPQEGIVQRLCIRPFQESTRVLRTVPRSRKARIVFNLEIFAKPSFATVAIDRLLLLACRFLFTRGSAADRADASPRSSRLSLVAGT